MKMILNRQHPQRRGTFRIGDIVENRVSPEGRYQIRAWDFCSWECSHSRESGCNRARNVMRLRPVDPRADRTFRGYMGTMCFCVGHRQFTWKVVRREHEKKFQHWKQKVV